MSKRTIVSMPGDGIGKTVLAETIRVLDAVGFEANYVEGDIGWEFWCKEGNPLPQRTLDLLSEHRIGLFGAITSWITRRKISDVTSGFQAVNRRVIEFYSHNYPSDYPEIETIPLLYRAGMRALEVPVAMRERQTGKTSITPIRSIYYVVKVLLALLMGLLRKTQTRERLESFSG